MGTKNAPPLIALVGPTASGKSSLAVELAEKRGGEIVNCDSMQLYRYLDIGTAKPGPEARARVPHHLYDVIDPDQTYSAGRYMREGRRVCRWIRERGRLPVVAGGTGLYLRALVEGLFEDPGRRPEVRRRLNRMADRKGVEFLHRLLARLDAAAAARIQPRDRTRLVRALEVCLTTGKPISGLQAQALPLEGYRIFKIGLNLNRPELYDRIDRRVLSMFREGLLDEVQDLLKRGFPSDCKALQGIGYRQAVRMLAGEMEGEEAVEQTQRSTRRYAKRQLTWFRKDPQVVWIDGPGEEAETLDRATELIDSLAT